MFKGGGIMEFILDEAINNVVSDKTKHYLKEVIADYYNKCYRSCIVSLYTIVIYDLTEKLLKLKDIYSEEKATKKLNEIEEEQKKVNYHYSEIEKKIYEASKEIGLFNNIEFKQLEQLKDARDNAAHSVFLNNYQLIEPTKEQTLSHIRNMFDAVFIKDIVISKKILNNFRDDICNYYSRQPELKNYDEYLMDKYYKRFNKETKKSMFTSLWNYAFIFDDNDCNKNRCVLVKTLVKFIEWDEQLFKEYLKNNNEKLFAKIIFDDVKKDYDGMGMFEFPVTAFIYVCNKFSWIYNIMPDYIKVSIKNVCNKNLALLYNAEFLFSGKKDHISNLTKWIQDTYRRSKPCINGILLMMDYNEYKNKFGHEFRLFFNEYYYKCVASSEYRFDFDYINSVYNNVISKVIDDYSENELIDLLEKIGDETNYKQSNISNQFKQQVKNKINTDNYDIDINKYWILI